MSTSIEYQFHNLAGRIDSAGPGFPADGDTNKNGGAALRIASGGPAGYLHMMKSWGGLALLVSLGVVGIPFLIYFLALGTTAILRVFG